MCLECVRALVRVCFGGLACVCVVWVCSETPFYHFPDVLVFR